MEHPECEKAPKKATRSAKIRDEALASLKKISTNSNSKVTIHTARHLIRVALLTGEH